jgi:hypothetical protein
MSQNQNFLFCSFRFVHLNSGKIVEPNRENQQEQEAPIPTGIKVITTRQKQQILVSKLFVSHEPIQHENNREKNGEI